MTDVAHKPGLSARSRALLWGVIAVLLVLPAVAMLFTSEMNWGPEDFVVAAILLGGTGLALELAARWLVDPRKRALAALAIVGALLVVWAELAVGIFD